MTCIASLQIAFGNRAKTQNLIITLLEVSDQELGYGSPFVTGESYFHRFPLFSLWLHARNTVIFLGSPKLARENRVPWSAKLDS
jgi:hypothetical protein